MERPITVLEAARTGPSGGAVEFRPGVVAQVAGVVRATITAIGSVGDSSIP
jgi:hypothetical protein